MAFLVQAMGPFFFTQKIGYPYLSVISTWDIVSRSTSLVQTSDVTTSQRKNVHRKNV